MPIKPDEMRQVMRQWASGVCLVTASIENDHHGMTVSSFASVALEPPLILVSLENSTRTNEMVRLSSRFAVVILAAEQQELSDLFAGRLSDEEDRFDGIEYFETEMGCAVPHGSLAYMDCRVASNYEAGTHTIFIGRVESSQIMNAGEPLLYFDQDYAQLQRSK